jgi:hypothetical protein
LCYQVFNFSHADNILIPLVSELVLSAGNSLKETACLKKRGEPTNAPHQARGCLSRSAFGAPQLGRASSTVLECEISTFRCGQQQKLREMILVKLFFWSFFRDGLCKITATVPRRQ